MEKFFDKTSKIILAIIAVLLMMGIATSSFAKTKLYTEGLKKGDVLKFTKNGATSWCVYKSKADAKKTGIKLAVNYIKPEDKITILSVATDCNVLKVKVENTKKNYTGFIHYGSTASKYFEVEKSTNINQLNSIIKSLKNKIIDSIVGGTRTGLFFCRDKKLVSIEQLRIGEEIQVIAKKYTAGCSPTVTMRYENIIENITWEVDNKKIATIDKNGILKGLSEGLVTITGKKDGVKINSKLTVMVSNKNKDEWPLSAEKLKSSKIIIEGENGIIVKNNKQIKIGEELLLSVGACITEHDYYPIENVIYKSSNENVAKIDEKGKVKGLSAGTAVITAETKIGEKIKGNFTVIVKPKNELSVKLEKNTINMYSEMEQKIVAKITGDSIKQINWTSSNNNSVRVESKGTKDAKIIAKMEGRSVITVTVTDKYGNKSSASCKVNVKRINKKTFSFLKNKNNQITINNVDSIKLAMGKDISVTKYDYNKEYMEINKSGILTAKKVGTTNIKIYVKYSKGIIRLNRCINCKVTIK